MRCLYCQEKAGFFKKICPDCSKLIHAFESLPKTYGYSQLLDQLLATEVPTQKIEKFLDTDVIGEGQGTLNDQITARMTNEVMAGLGQPSNMTGEAVQQVRKDIAEGRAPSLTDKEHLEH